MQKDARLIQTKTKSALADEGGNTFTIELSDEPPRRRGIRKKKFHGFWDYDTVNALFPQVPGGLPKKEFETQIDPLKASTGPRHGDP